MKSKTRNIHRGCACQNGQALTVAKYDTEDLAPFDSNRTEKRVANLSTEWV